MAAEGLDRLRPRAAALMSDACDDLIFSAANIWEVATTQGLGRPGSNVDAALLRRSLLDNASHDLPVSGTHAVPVAALPPVHKDLFDRILAAQAGSEGLVLLTADRVVARYPGPTQLV